MVLEPDVVAFGMSLYLDRHPSSEEINRLAAMLGSREELFAHIFTKTRFLEFHPDIRMAVESLVRRYGDQVATKRPAVGAPAAARNLAARTRDEVLSIISSDAVAGRSTLNLDDLDRKSALYSSETATFVNAPERWFAP